MIDKENIFSKEIGISDVLDYTVLAVKKCFKEILFFTLIFYLPFVFALIAINYFFISGVLKTVLFAGVIIFYYMFLNPFYKSILIKVIHFKVTTKSELKWARTFKEILTKTHKLLISNFIRAILLVVILVIVFFIGLMLSGILTAMSAMMVTVFIKISTSLVVFISVIVSISIILILYGLFMYPYFRLGYIMHFMIIEGTSFSYSFKRSLSVTNRGYFKTVFSYLTVILLALTLGVGIVLVPTIVMQYFGMEDIRSIIEQLSIILAIMCYPSIITLSTILYLSQKRENEGIDLLLRSRKLFFEKKNELEMVDKDENNLF